MLLESAFRSRGINTKTSTRQHADGLRFSKHTWPRFLRCAPPTTLLIPPKSSGPGQLVLAKRSHMSKSKRTNQRRGQQRNLPQSSRRLAERVHCLFSHGAKRQQCEVSVLFHFAEREKQWWRRYSTSAKGACNKTTTKVTAAGCATTTFPSVTTGATTSTRDKKRAPRFSVKVAIIAAPSLRTR